MKNRLSLLLIISSLQLNTHAKNEKAITKEQPYSSVCFHDCAQKNSKIYQVQRKRPKTERRVYQYIPDQDYSKVGESMYCCCNYCYYNYWRRSYWRHPYVGGYPYGYWPSFGEGFGYGGRRGSYTFGFAW